jgi:hypothetical protein
LNVKVSWNVRARLRSGDVGGDAQEKSNLLVALAALFARIALTEQHRAERVGGCRRLHDVDPVFVPNRDRERAELVEKLRVLGFARLVAGRIRDFHPSHRGFNDGRATELQFVRASRQPQRFDRQEEGLQDGHHVFPAAVELGFERLPHGSALA